MTDLIVNFKPGECLFKQGDLSQDLYIIQSGIVRVYRQNKSSNQIWPLALVHSGGFIGEMSFFDGKPRSATADAVTEVSALKLEAGKLRTELQKLPSWLMVMVKGLADRVRESNELIQRHKITDEKLSEEFQKWSASLTPSE